MGVTVKGMRAVCRSIQSVSSRLDDVIIMNLQYLGEEMVAYVRDRTAEDSWIDQTGNLRSSIGYIILHDGKIAQTSDFQSVKAGQEGSAQGKAFAESFASKIPKGYALVIVAGMNYAAYVEAHKNKDVLASAELKLKPEVDRMINELKNAL